MRKISSTFSQPLYSVAATREIERQAAARLPPRALRQRAGLSIARLALALAPHAQRIWVACGPGNNGGDGFEAAGHLHQWGKTVVVTWTGLSTEKSGLPPDADASRQQALVAGVPVATQPPQDFDFCIDALLGSGAMLNPSRAGTELMQHWLEVMQTSQVPRLSVEVPTGLDADTGFTTLINATKSTPHYGFLAGAAALFTLSLLTLKPGLFTASGRDSAGEIWFDDLGIDLAASGVPSAWLLGADRAMQPLRKTAPHASHKGSFGDVAILGGESAPATHMTGAALLAARAALHAGAGRVSVALLGNAGPTFDPQQPELMFRTPEALDLKHQVVVCGCGGGEAVKTVIAKVLSSATQAVLDADALNAIAADPQLQSQLKVRQHRAYSTVLTPHPLEAARLLGSTAAKVQGDRLAAASLLAEQFQCVVVLKGSGTVIAAPGQHAHINATGNALLASAGTGDVLAGMIGAYMARGLGVFEAACSAVFVHGREAEAWITERPGQALTASALAGALTRSDQA